MRRRALFLLVMGACAGAEPADGLALRLSESRSAPGDSLELVPSNGTSDLIGYNLCPATLSIEVRGDWTPVPSDRICTMELRTLDPGREGRYDLQLPADLEPGRYRYQTDVVNLSTDAIEQISSEAFDVE